MPAKKDLDPAYAKTTIFFKRELADQVRMRLIPQRVSVQRLVETLLEEWYAGKRKAVVPPKEHRMVAAVRELVREATPEQLDVLNQALKTCAALGKKK